MNFVHHAYFNATTKTDIFNVNHDIKRAVREAQILQGVVTIYVPGSTANLVILENDPMIREEFKKMIESFIPSSSGARPSRKSGSGALAAHLRASFLSTSVSIPIKDGRLLLGPWQEVLVFDFDDKVARREVIIQVYGEGAEKKKSGKF